MPIRSSKPAFVFLPLRKRSPILSAPALPAVAEATPEPLSAPSREVKSSDAVDESSVASARLRMREIDGRYVDMVAKPPAEWDIIGIEEGYRAVIRSLPSGDPLVESLENRISALAEPPQDPGRVPGVRGPDERHVAAGRRACRPPGLSGRPPGGADPDQPDRRHDDGSVRHAALLARTARQCANGQPSFTDGWQWPRLARPRRHLAGLDDEWSEHRDEFLGSDAGDPAGDRRPARPDPGITSSLRLRESPLRDRPRCPSVVRRRE